MQKCFALSVAGVALTLFFQNCSSTAFSGGKTTQASSVTNASTGTTTTSTGGCPQVLCAFDVGQISQVQLTGETSTILGTYEVNLAVSLNPTAETLNGTVSFLVGSATLASCAANGSNAQLSDLEADLEALQFSTTESAAGPTNLASVVLTFVLTNGEQKSYRVDSNTTSASVQGLQQINAVALVEQLSSMALNASCSTSL